ncbi:hypothetical protein J6590_020225 [Homalodisca vitripennis]|nr:hypothetical protein J6590_020225 [Homalodisca vitripennis]
MHMKTRSDRGCGPERATSMSWDNPRWVEGVRAPKNVDKEGPCLCLWSAQRPAYLNSRHSLV